MKKNLLIIAAILCSMALNAQSNWQWRGENRDGIYNETGLLKEWPARGPQLLWHFEGLGEGHTSVAIANGKIYITGMHGNRLILFVFDMAGKLLTQKEIGREWNTNWNGTRSSVCINDGKLYIFSGVGTLYCLDEVSLNAVWTKDLLKDFDGRELQFGMAENPLIVGDKIFATPGGVKNNMVALNKNTGELIWSSAGLGTASTYSSPIYIGDQSVPMVVTYVAAAQQGGRSSANDNKLVAFNADTGEVLWSHSQPSENTINPNTPIYSDGLIFSSTGYRGGSYLLRLKDGGKAVEQVWHNPADNQHHGFVKVGDYVYITGQNNRGFYCIDWKTGETKYRENNYALSAMVFADGMLYCYEDRGRMSLIKPNPNKFELVSSFNVTIGDNQHWAHPVIHQGVLYIRHGKALMAYKVK